MDFMAPLDPELSVAFCSMTLQYYAETLTIYYRESSNFSRFSAVLDVYVGQEVDREGRYS
jgi:hypothetical protein